MGQAKQRGSFKERQAEAVSVGKTKSQFNSYQPPSAAMILAKAFKYGPPGLNKATK